MQGRYKKEQIAAWLEEWKLSGKSSTEFSVDKPFHSSTLDYWRRKSSKKELPKSFITISNPVEIHQKVSFITVDPLNELDDQYSVTLEKSDSQKLLDLLKQDIAEASPQELIGIPCGQMELYATSYADMDEHIAPESYAEVGRYIFPTFKRTLVFLKEKGYAFVMEKENLKQYDYSVTYNAEEMDVTDPEQKEELAQSLIRELECPAWLETEAGVSVKVALNSTESAGESLNGIEFAVLKAKEPEFIKKIVETGEEEE